MASGRSVRMLLGVLALFGALSARATAADQPAPRVRRPNVILFLVDDMGWRDCGVYGSTFYETPHIDAFARKAMRFTDAYAQPLCSPTRASLMTGKYSARHGITSATGHQPPQPEGFQFLPETAPPGQAMRTPVSKNYLEPSEYTLAEALRDAGYRTAHIGKWHLGLTSPHWPEQQGFEIAFHCHPDPGPPGGYFSPYGVRRTGEPKGQLRVGTITDGPDGEYIVDRQAEEAVKFIETRSDKPFFLNLWCYGVHGPWGHKEAYTREFQARIDANARQKNPIMASMMRSVDECFGKILAAVEKNGLADDTIIVFNSDNGGNVHSNTAGDAEARPRRAPNPALADWKKWAGNEAPTSNWPLRDGKGTLYEGGTRVPLMWSWPGRIAAGATNASVVGHIDLYPTLLELAGIPRPKQQQMDGESYASVLRGTGPIARDAFFNYFPHGRSPGRAGGVWVRRGDRKLIRWFGTPPEQRFELYDLKADLAETTNLAATSSEEVRQLDALIDDFLKETGATSPRDNPAFEAQSPSR
ncbi:Arylsulfatase [Caulifigura coniformis]|uniref:Arylsulfatase n=1 Tax=Caulifigura coniformis TaxID=2527983 RepID=A0A517SHW1_9PLAN|nr:sulfatase [Caulifigura coniformis]QDT55712.1 Arylsulfatase [Caulifigura coniformis]